MSSGIPLHSAAVSFFFVVLSLATRTSLFAIEHIEDPLCLVGDCVREIVSIVGAFPVRFLFVPTDGYLT